MENLKVKAIKDFIGARHNKKGSIITIQESDYQLYKKMGFIEDIKEEEVSKKDNKESDIEVQTKEPKKVAKTSKKKGE